MSTYFPSSHDITRKWFVIDASGKTLGRLATEAASTLSGKNNPKYTPFIDMGDHVVVVSHRPKPEGWHPEASYYFAGTVTRGIARARELAGDGVVAICAGDVAGQALALGLVDEVAMDVVPVVFGSGKRYFGPVEGQHLLEDPHVVIQGDRVLHLRYRVRQAD